jgi:hypothetical protein
MKQNLDISNSDKLENNMYSNTNGETNWQDKATEWISSAGQVIDTFVGGSDPSELPSDTGDQKDPKILGMHPVLAGGIALAVTGVAAYFAIKAFRKSKK